MLVSVAVAVPVSTAHASDEPSGVCTNGYGDDIQLLSGDFGLPLWLGVQWADTSGHPVVFLCYGTDAPDQPKTLGGDVRVDPGNGEVRFINRSDSNAGNQTNARLHLAPTYTVSPGGASGGQVLSFEIPVTMCSGPCHDIPGGGVAATGLIVGQISQQSAPGGVSAAYRVSQLCLKVNGIEVTNCDTTTDLPGATTTGNQPANVGTGGATPGPCAVGVCIPSIDYVGTSGKQLATIYLPDNTPIPVYGTRVCLYQKDPATACPA